MQVVRSADERSLSQGPARFQEQQARPPFLALGAD